MQKFYITSILTFISIALISCSPMARDYQGQGPDFDIYEYLTGNVVGQGLFLDRSGKVQSRFKVEIQGTQVDGGLVLNETISYQKGDIEKRTWKILKKDRNALSATTADVNGEASISNYGFAAQWNYQMVLNVDGSRYNLDFDDWMFQMNDGLMLNRATVTKWGFKVGEVLISFQKK